MDEKKSPTSGPSDEQTQTIDLNGLFSKDVTCSGSFDIRSDIWATTFGRLIQALPSPALLIDRSLNVIVANEACSRISRDFKKILNSPFSEVFPDSVSANKVRSIVEEVFSTRKVQRIKATVRIEKSEKWLHMSFRSIRIMQERYVFLLIEDLTAEKKQLLLQQKHNEQLRREITARKEMEHSLRESETRFRAIYDGSPVMMHSIDEEGRIVSVNRKWLEETGYTNEEVIGRKLDFLMTGKSAERAFSEVISRLGCDGSVRDVPYQYVRKDGTTMDVLLDCNATVDQSGKRISLTVVRNVTEQKRAEASLRESEERFKQVAESAGEWIWEVDAAGLYRYCSSAVEKILGYSPDELVGQKRFYDLIAPDVREDLKEAALGAFERRETFRAFANPNVHKNGNIIFLETSGTPVQDQEGNLLGYRGADTDITERKKAEAVLRESEARHRNLVEHLPQRIFVKDRNSVYVSCNAKYAADLGIVPEEIAGKDDFAFFPPELAQVYRADDQACMASGMVKDLEEPYRLAENERWVHTIKVPYRDEQGQVIGVLGIFEDITDRKKAEEALHWNETLLRQMATTSPLAYFVVDNRTDDILYFNNRFCKIWGIERLSDQMQQKVLKNNDIIPDCIPLIKDLEAFAASCKPLQNEEDRSVVEDEIEFVDDRTIRRFSTLLRDELDRYYCRFYIFEDISDRKRRENLLRESETRYRALFENSPDGILIADVETKRFAQANPSVCRMLGYTPEELRALGLADIHPHDQLPQVIAEFEAQARGEKVLAPNIPCLRKDGTVFYADISTTAAVLGGRACNVGFFRDITERKRAEEALRESEERLQLALRGADLGLWDYNLQTGEALINQRRAEMVGYSADEIEPHISSWWRIVHPDDRQRVVEAFNAHSKGETPFYECEHRLRCKSGEYIWVLARAKIVERDATGSPVRLTGTSLDITERKKAEEALRKSEEFNRSLVEHAPFGIAYLAGDGTVEYVNPAGNRIMGIPEGQVSPLLGRNILELPGLHDRSRVQEDVRRLLEGESLSDLEMPYKSSMGRDTMLLVAATPRFSTDGTVAGGILMFTDISERKRAEELQRQTARYRAVADLAGGVAHNFNNLLQIVIGNLELVLMDLDMGNYTDIRNSLEKVLKSSQFGAETVRRLQSFAGIRDHSQLPERGVYDLSGIVRQAVEMSEAWWKTIPEKQGRKVSLNLHLQDGCLVQCEKNELFEVVVNLIKNATEALTQDGAIDVETRVEGDQVILKVRDTGVGISEQDLKRLFNPFFTTKADAGAGLGLAASSKIIEDCAGNILADSAEGKGTTFTVVLPLIKEEPKPPRTEKTPAIVQPLVVLAIDDEEAILDLLKKVLARRNYEVLTALSGEMGLDIFKENPVDLVICDLGMPGMTGWEVGKRIRAICEERGIKKTFFMLLTGWGGQKTEVAKIAESGVDVIIEKPLNIKNLLEAVREVAEKTLSENTDE